MVAKGISSDWTRHLPTDKRKDFEQVLRNSTLISNRLADILEERLQAILRSETSGYEDFTGDWANKQAFRNGQKQAIKAVLDLFSFTKGKDT
jgi:hypothetical protein